MSGLITMTARAEEALKERMAMNESAIGIRLSVTNTGCSGHAYKMEHVIEESPEDERFEQGGAVLFVPKKHLLFVMGTEIDFNDDHFASTFVFNNPNAEGTCGCGESFNIKPSG